MIIYLATNKKNGKRYLGATRHSLAHRRNQHWHDANNRNCCRIFGAALKKYGRDGFEWCVLATCSSLDEMASEEIRLIAEMRPEYNITVGGQGVFGVPYTEARRAKLSKSLTGRKLSPDHRAKNAARLADMRAQRHRAVVCLNDGVFYASCKDAAHTYSITHSNVRAVAEGGQATTKGGLSFHFSDAPMSREECDARIRWLLDRKADGIRRSEESRRRPVLCLTDGREFPYALAAADFYGMTASNVKALCYDGGTSQGGLSFTFVGCAPVLKKGLTPESAARQEAARRRGVLKNSKRVICLDDNTVYDSISDAARAIGRCVESVSASIRRNGRTGGKAFKFVE